MNEIQKVEYNGILVLTTQQIAEAYGTNTDTITKNFNRNKDRYVGGKHYIALEGEEKNSFVDRGQFDRGLKNAKTLYLWTKKGAFLHAKSLNTDTAWEVYDRLVDEYFELKENAKPKSSAEMLLMYAQQFYEQEKRLSAVEDNIKILEAKVTTHNDDYYTIAGYASLRGLNVDINKANMLGRKASKLSKEYGYDISKTKDTRFGTVNTYHVDILKEVFKR